MSITILTEDWFNGYTPRDERFTFDADFELDDEERDEYSLITEDSHFAATREMEWLHRDEDDNSILLRWNQPDDVLDELQAIEDADERGLWTERMTAFRRAQLHRLLAEYFGTSDYVSKELVLRWEQRDGRWIAAEKMPVLDWINAKVEEKGSLLSGFASCCGTLRSKITRKRVSREGSAKWWETYNRV